MITLHSLLENGQDIPEELSNIRYFSENLNKLMGKSSNHINWRQERDNFIACWTKLVIGSQENLPNSEVSFEDIGRLCADSISSNNFPETIECKSKPKGRDRKKKDKKEPE
jgi:hypothetical protein